MVALWRTGAGEDGSCKRPLRHARWCLLDAGYPRRELHISALGPDGRQCIARVPLPAGQAIIFSQPPYARCSPSSTPLAPAVRFGWLAGGLAAKA